MSRTNAKDKEKLKEKLEYIRTKIRQGTKILKGIC